MVRWASVIGGCSQRGNRSGSARTHAQTRSLVISQRALPYTFPFCPSGVRCCTCWEPVMCVPCSPWYQTSYPTEAGLCGRRWCIRLLNHILHSYGDGSQHQFARTSSGRFSADVLFVEHRSSVFMCSSAWCIHIPPSAGLRNLIPQIGFLKLGLRETGRNEVTPKGTTSKDHKLPK